MLANESYLCFFVVFTTLNGDYFLPERLKNAAGMAKCVLACVKSTLKTLFSKFLSKPSLSYFFSAWSCLLLI